MPAMTSTVEAVKGLHSGRRLGLVITVLTGHLQDSAVLALRMQQGQLACPGSEDAPIRLCI